jgi:PAS domain S-box-containing protein
MSSLISRTVFDSLSEQVIVIDVVNYTITDVNQALLKTLKLKREDVIGKTCYEITHRRETRCAPPHDICPIAEMLEKGRPITAEHLHFDAERKPFYVEVSAYPIKDKKGKITHAIHIAKDITERKEIQHKLNEYTTNLERMVEERTSQLRDSERLAAIGQIAAMVGHDMRSPLQAMIGDIYLMLVGKIKLKNKNGR